MRQIDAIVAHAPRLKIGLVQPNIPYTIDGEFSSEEAVRELTALQEQRGACSSDGAELIVWSEGSYPRRRCRGISPPISRPDSAAMIRRGISMPLVIGASTYDSRARRCVQFGLAARCRRQGRRPLRQGSPARLRRIRPRHRVLSLAAQSPAGGRRADSPPGTGPAILPLVGPNGRDLGARARSSATRTSCPGFLRRVAALHPNLLVNLTSDSWFGAGSEPWEHLALAVFATRRDAGRDGARGELRRVGAHRSERPAARENLRGRPLPPSASRRTVFWSTRRACRGETRSTRNTATGSRTCASSASRRWGCFGRKARASGRGQVERSRVLLEIRARRLPGEPVLEPNLRVGGKRSDRRAMPW